MGKVSVPGLKAADGKMGFELLAPGDYLMKLHAPKVKPSENSPGMNYNFAFDVVDGPDQPNGRPAEGRKFFENIWVMSEEHPDYEPNKPSIGANTMKALITAAGVRFTGDEFNTDAFEDLEVGVSVKIVNEKKNRRDPDSETIERNRVALFFAAEDFVDVSKPAPKKAKAGAKAPAKKAKKPAADGE
jgi:hypothetical protein